MTGDLLKPFAVPMRVARRLLGDKARSEVYEAIGQQRLVALKDGNKVLITTASIERYLASLPPAQIKAPAPRKNSKIKMIEATT